MQISPLIEYATPRFPTREILDRHPELLKLVPKRWQGNATVLTALAMGCLLISGCGNRSGKPAKASLVAPLFVHGSGRGSFGCEVVNPPAFLSEAEARDVIVAEAKRAGIIFAKDPGSRFDGLNAKRGICYRFVSREQCEPSALSRFLVQSSVHSYDVFERARALRDELSAASPEGSYAVFYDPMYRPTFPKPLTDQGLEALRKAQRNNPAMEREQLREQVRDFIKWLKAQGVI